MTRSVTQVDAPEHGLDRRMLAPGLTPARLRAREGRVRARVRLLPDRAREARECDWGEVVTAELLQALACLVEKHGTGRRDGQILASALATNDTNSRLRQPAASD